MYIINKGILLHNYKDFFSTWILILKNSFFHCELYYWRRFFFKISTNRNTYIFYISIYSLWVILIYIVVKDNGF